MTDLETKRNALMNKVESGLPTYDYIKALDHNSIPIGLIFDSTKKYKIETTAKIYLSDINNYSFYKIGTQSALLKTFSGGFKVRAFTNTNIASISNNVYFTSEQTIENGIATTTIDTTTNTESVTISGGEFSMLGGKVVLKETKIYVDDVLTYDLVPSEKNGQYGMVNTVDNTFYTNPSGTYEVGDD